MKPQYITNKKGKKTAVILSMKDYQKLLDEVDEAHCVKLYDEAKHENLTFRPLADVLKQQNKLL